MNQENMDQALSDLADGRANEHQLQLLLTAWERDESLRREWQTLHVIGSALRSPDLAAPAQSGEALLGALRGRIAREPVPLRRRGWADWLPAVGVAAAFVMVALLLPSLSRPQPPSPDVIAQSPASPALAQGLVELPSSRTLDGAPSFVQAVVAPAPLGLMAEPTPRQALLRADPIPLAHAASSGMP